MKNAIFWVLALVVVVILALLGYGIYLSVANAPSGFDVLTAVCTGFLLVGSLVAWELLMKPGYYRKRREARREETPPRDDAPNSPPPSR
ncbi:MAG TPA: hypothetical protein VK723_06520 [Thermoplasmata archaeon]|nr:hypothetical protein [Thermoplasmata archaeon]